MELRWTLYRVKRKGPLGKGMLDSVEDLEVNNALEACCGESLAL